MQKGNIGPAFLPSGKWRRQKRLGWEVVRQNREQRCW